MRQSRHLLVANLPDNITEERITDHFKRFGKVQSVKFLPSSGCGLSAAVAFTDIRSAEKAYNDDNKIEERLLKTDYYEPPASSTSQSAIFIHETREDALSVRRANSSSHNSSSSTTSTSASSASYGSTSGVSGSKFSHRREAPSSRGSDNPSYERNNSYDRESYKRHSFRESDRVTRDDGRYGRCSSTYRDSDRLTSPMSTSHFRPVSYASHRTSSSSSSSHLESHRSSFSSSTELEDSQNSRQAPGTSSSLTSSLPSSRPKNTTTSASLRDQKDAKQPHSLQTQSSQTQQHQQQQTVRSSYNRTPRSPGSSRSSSVMSNSSRTEPMDVDLADKDLSATVPRRRSTTDLTSSDCTIALKENVHLTHSSLVDAKDSLKRKYSENDNDSNVGPDERKLRLLECHKEVNPSGKERSSESSHLRAASDHRVSIKAEPMDEIQSTSNQWRRKLNDIALTDSTLLDILIGYSNSSTSNSTESNPKLSRVSSDRDQRIAVVATIDRRSKSDRKPSVSSIGHSSSKQANRSSTIDTASATCKVVDAVNAGINHSLIDPRRCAPISSVYPAPSSPPSASSSSSLLNSSSNALDVTNVDSCTTIGDGESGLVTSTDSLPQDVHSTTCKNDDHGCEVSSSSDQAPPSVPVKSGSEASSKTPAREPMSLPLPEFAALALASASVKSVTTLPGLANIVNPAALNCKTSSITSPVNALSPLPPKRIRDRSTDSKGSEVTTSDRDSTENATFKSIDLSFSNNHQQQQQHHSHHHHQHSVDRSPHSPSSKSLEDQIKALDDKIKNQAVWSSNSNSASLIVATASVPSTPTIDYSKYNIKKKTQVNTNSGGSESARSEPSDVFKSILSKSSIFDQDSKRLEHIKQEKETSPTTAPAAASTLQSSTSTASVAGASATSAAASAANCSSNDTRQVKILKTKAEAKEFPPASSAASSTETTVKSSTSSGSSNCSDKHKSLNQATLSSGRKTSDSSVKSSSTSSSSSLSKKEPSTPHSAPARSFSSSSTSYPFPSHESKKESTSKSSAGSSASNSGTTSVSAPSTEKSIKKQESASSKLDDGSSKSTHGGEKKHLFQKSVSLPTGSTGKCSSSSSSSSSDKLASNKGDKSLIDKRRSSDESIAVDSDCPRQSNLTSSKKYKQSTSPNLTKDSSSSGISSKSLDKKCKVSADKTARTSESSKVSSEKGDKNIDKKSSSHLTKKSDKSDKNSNSCSSNSSSSKVDSKNIERLSSSKSEKSSRDKDKVSSFSGNREKDKEKRKKDEKSADRKSSSSSGPSCSSGSKSSSKSNEKEKSGKERREKLDKTWAELRKLGVTEEPVYMSMYDKVKARSSANQSAQKKEPDAPGKSGKSSDSGKVKSRKDDDSSSDSDSSSSSSSGERNIFPKRKRTVVDSSSDESDQDDVPVKAAASATATPVCKVSSQRSKLPSKGSSRVVADSDSDSDDAFLKKAKAKCIKSKKQRLYSSASSDDDVLVKSKSKSLSLPPPPPPSKSTSFLPSSDDESDHEVKSTCESLKKHKKVKKKQLEKSKKKITCDSSKTSRSDSNDLRIGKTSSSSCSTTTSTTTTTTTTGSSSSSSEKDVKERSMSMSSTSSRTTSTLDSKSKCKQLSKSHSREKERKDILTLSKDKSSRDSLSESHSSKVSSLSPKKSSKKQAKTSDKVKKEDKSSTSSGSSSKSSKPLHKSSSSSSKSVTSDQEALATSKGDCLSDSSDSDHAALRQLQLDLMHSDSESDSSSRPVTSKGSGVISHTEWERADVGKVPAPIIKTSSHVEAKELKEHKNSSSGSSGSTGLCGSAKKSTDKLHCSPVESRRRSDCDRKSKDDHSTHLAEVHESKKRNKKRDSLDTRAPAIDIKKEPITAPSVSSYHLDSKSSPPIVSSSSDIASTSLASCKSPDPPIDSLPIPDDSSEASEDMKLDRDLEEEVRRSAEKVEHLESDASNDELMISSSPLSDGNHSEKKEGKQQAPRSFDQEAAIETKRLEDELTQSWNPPPLHFDDIITSSTKAHPSADEDAASAIESELLDHDHHLIHPLHPKSESQDPLLSDTISRTVTIEETRIVEAREPEVDDRRLEEELSAVSALLQEMVQPEPEVVSEPVFESSTPYAPLDILTDDEPPQLRIAEESESDSSHPTSQCDLSKNLLVTQVTNLPSSSSLSASSLLTEVKRTGDTVPSDNIESVGSVKDSPLPNTVSTVVTCSLTPGSISPNKRLSSASSEASDVEKELTSIEAASAAASIESEPTVKDAECVKSEPGAESATEETTAEICDRPKTVRGRRVKSRRASEAAPAAAAAAASSTTAGAVSPVSASVPSTITPPTTSVESNSMVTSVVSSTVTPSTASLSHPVIASIPVTTCTSSTAPSAPSTSVSSSNVTLEVNTRHRRLPAGHLADKIRRSPRVEQQQQHQQSLSKTSDHGETSTHDEGSSDEHRLSALEGDHSSEENARRRGRRKKLSGDPVNGKPGDSSDVKTSALSIAKQSSDNRNSAYDVFEFRDSDEDETPLETRAPAPLHVPSKVPSSVSSNQQSSLPCSSVAPSVAEIEALATSVPAPVPVTSVAPSLAAAISPNTGSTATPVAVTSCAPLAQGVSSDERKSVDDTAPSTPATEEQKESEGDKEYTTELSGHGKLSITIRLHQKDCSETAEVIKASKAVIPEEATRTPSSTVVALTKTSNDEATVATSNSSGSVDQSVKATRKSARLMSQHKSTVDEVIEDVIKGMNKGAGDCAGDGSIRAKRRNVLRKSDDAPEGTLNDEELEELEKATRSTRLTRSSARGSICSDDASSDQGHHSEHESGQVTMQRRHSSASDSVSEKVPLELPSLPVGKDDTAPLSETANVTPSLPVTVNEPSICQQPQTIPAQSLHHQTSQQVPQAPQQQLQQVSPSQHQQQQQLQQQQASAPPLAVSQSTALVVGGVSHSSTAGTSASTVTVTPVTPAAPVCLTELAPAAVSSVSTVKSPGITKPSVEATSTHVISPQVKEPSVLEVKSEEKERVTLVTSESVASVSDLAQADAKKSHEAVGPSAEIPATGVSIKEICSSNAPAICVNTAAVTAAAPVQSVIQEPLRSAPLIPSVSERLHNSTTAQKLKTGKHYIFDDNNITPASKSLQALPLPQPQQHHQQQQQQQQHQSQIPTSVDSAGISETHHSSSAIIEGETGKHAIAAVKPPPAHTKVTLELKQPTVSSVVASYASQQQQQQQQQQQSASVVATAIEKSNSVPLVSRTPEPRSTAPSMPHQHLSNLVDPLRQLPPSAAADLSHVIHQRELVSARLQEHHRLTHGASATPPASPSPQVSAAAAAAHLAQFRSIAPGLPPHMQLHADLPFSYPPVLFTHPAYSASLAAAAAAGGPRMSPYQLQAAAAAVAAEQSSKEQEKNRPRSSKLDEETRVAPVTSAADELFKRNHEILASQGMNVAGLRVHPPLSFQRHHLSPHDRITDSPAIAVAANFARGLHQLPEEMRHSPAPKGVSVKDAFHPHAPHESHLPHPFGMPSIGSPATGCYPTERGAIHPPPHSPGSRAFHPRVPSPMNVAVSRASAPGDDERNKVSVSSAAAAALAYHSSKELASPIAESIQAPGNHSTSHQGGHGTSHPSYSLHEGLLRTSTSIPFVPPMASDAPVATSLAHTHTSQPSLHPATPPQAQVPASGDSHLLQRYPIVWQGLLSLKNDQAAVQMHFISGSIRIAQNSLPKNPEGGANAPVRISQRMRLEQTQLEGVARKMQMQDEHCILLALPCGRDQMDVLQQSEHLKTGFINYLQSKQAAGIVNSTAPGSQNTAYVIHIFPSGDFSNGSLARIAPDLLDAIKEIAHLMIIIATV